MTVDLLPQHLAARVTGSSWMGRASQYRREQAQGRGIEGVARIEKAWATIVDVLGAIEGPTSALLCTTEGAPVAAYGMVTQDLPRAARLTRSVFAASLADDEVDEPGRTYVDTTQLLWGQRHTVMVSVPCGGETDHVFSVTAEGGVSLQVLEAWARHAAESLRVLLAQD